MLPPSYKTQAVRPMECLEAGWALVKPQYWLLAAITAVGILVASFVPLGILQGPMFCGIYLVLFAIMQGQRVEFGLLFKGFDYFLESLIATLVQLGLSILVMLPSLAVFLVMTFVLMPQQRGGGGVQPQPPIAFFLVAGVLGLVAVALMLVIGVLCAFAYPLIADRKLGGLDAIKASVAAARSNFWGLLGLVVLNALLAILGVTCCYIGVFFVLPICFGSVAHAYREVFGLATALPGEPPALAPVG